MHSGPVSFSPFPLCIFCDAKICPLWASQYGMITPRLEVNRLHRKFVMAIIHEYYHQLEVSVIVYEYEKLADKILAVPFVRQKRSRHQQDLNLCGQSPCDF